MSTLQNFKDNRINQLKELLNQIYNELYSIDKVKGFENPDMWKPSNFSDYLTDALRSHYMRTTYSIDWDETSEMYYWLRSMADGPPKPPLEELIHKKLKVTFRYPELL